MLNKESLASQPAISRLNNRLTIDTLKSYEKIKEILLDKIYSIQMPEHIIFDIDSINFKTYGDEYGADYNSHYRGSEYMFK